MTSKMQWSVVAFMVCGFVSAAGDRVRAGQASGSGASVGVTKVERAWERAIQNKDSAAVDKILAADWVGLNPDGTLETRSHFLMAVKNGEYATTKLDDVTISTLSGVVVGHGRSSDKDGKYAYSDVFVRLNGEWRAAYTQVGLLPAPAKK
jgi:Domain of unknown function (DUF4440)